MGYFFSFLAIVVTTYWLYRGIRYGLYPSLNILMVFFLPLLITLNYYNVLFSVVGKVAPESSPTTRETISFIATYAIAFVVLLYFCLWLCVDVMRIHKAVDAIGGGILGIVAGVVCCGVLMLIWFSMPFSRAQFPVPEASIFFPAHRMTLQMATFVAGRIEGDRRFSGERFLRDLRYGLPSIPTVGDGFYVASIPNGQRLFVDTAGGNVKDFLIEIKKRLENPDMDIPPSQQRAAFGERGRTPAYINQSGREALVAVIMDNVPEGVTAFVHDNEVYSGEETISDQRLFIKVYRVPKPEAVASVIALFQPCNPNDPKDTKLAEQFLPDFLPSRECFRFNEQDMKSKLGAAGINLSAEEIDRLIPQLKFGGKAWFLGRLQAPYIAEVLGGGEFRVEPVVPPEKPGEAKPPRSGGRTN